MAYCVMVKGPCRGKMCDFWVRVRIRKLHIDELAQELQNRISKCLDGLTTNLDDAISQFWSEFGIKDLRRFCQEEPDLCSKVKRAEERTRRSLLLATCETQSDV